MISQSSHSNSVEVACYSHIKDEEAMSQRHEKMTWKCLMRSVFLLSCYINFLLFILICVFEVFLQIYGISVAADICFQGGKKIHVKILVTRKLTVWVLLKPGWAMSTFSILHAAISKLFDSIEESVIRHVIHLERLLWHNSEADSAQQLALQCSAKI